VTDPADPDGAEPTSERTSMTRTSLTNLVDEHLALARAATSGRSAHTIHGGHGRLLHQTLITLAAGQQLREHESPGEATLQVLRGRVRLNTGDAGTEGVAGDILVIPDARHSVDAIEDAGILLTVAWRQAPTTN
jgi:quercetin dioxygenase-like cupin family protein